MKANLQDQQTLLKIAEIDLAIARIKRSVNELEFSNQLEIAREDLLETSDLLIDARARVGDLELELRRSENDLELVENRLKRDETRLVEARNQKDAAGLQHEIESLRNRRSELEDAELVVMESLEIARAEVTRLEEQKRDKEDLLTELEQGLLNKLSKLRSEQTDASNSRNLVSATLDPALLTAYQKKAERGAAVGRLIGRDCGACRLSITATSFDEISSLPADELAECPSCGAFLVRS